MTEMPARPAALDRLWRRMPTEVDRRIRLFAWLSLASQVIIVGTGGAVRLTGSGLGCDTWPRCTADSFVPTPELGIHGAIEFGNRLMTFVLVIIAIAMFLLVWQQRRERRDLFALALTLGLGIPMQGVIGGITVWSGLNPYVVGLHFVLSTVLVCLATVLVYRVYYGQRGRSFAVPAGYRLVARVAGVVVAVTVLVGILTTGSGPHAGDGGAARNGLDSELLQHVHAWPAYLTFALTVVLVAWSWRLRDGRLALFSGLLLLTELVQIGVGLYQARTGLPVLAVGIHMVLACVVAALTCAVLLALRRSPAD